MAGGRNNRCVIRGGLTKKVMPHDEFMERIKKTLYYGQNTSYKDISVSRPLAEYASELFSEPHRGHSLNRLNKVTAGAIHASPCSLIMALIYLDRLQATDPNYARRITPSELFIVSMMISTKFYCGLDEEIYISDWAKEGKIGEERLKELELNFLTAIEWNIYISNEQFFEKLSSVEKILARREGLRRGWLTYTELLNFLPSFTIAKFLLNNIVVMVVSYAASVITIAGAFFLVSHIPGNALRSKLAAATTDIQLESGNSSDIMNSDTRIGNDCTVTNENVACEHINIEEELEKLKRQYNETETELSKPYNENAGPLINLNENYLMKSTKIGIETGVNWQSFKDDDDICHEWKNCTNSSFLWNILQSKVNIFPYIWFKYI